MEKRTAAMLRDEAEELASSFINGNRMYVVGEILSDPHEGPLSLLVYQTLTDWNSRGAAFDFHNLLTSKSLAGK